VSYYGAGSHCTAAACVRDDDACTPGVLDCACAAGNSCDATFVCDTETTLCRGAKSCADMACLLHQRCSLPANGQDAACLAECEPGYDWAGDAEGCVPTASNCTAGEPDSILSACNAQHRMCVMETVSAHCGTCIDGYEEQAGACVVGHVGCTNDTVCAATTGRACEQSGNTGSCTGDCLPDFIEEDATTCRPRVTCEPNPCEVNEVCRDLLPDQDAACLPVDLNECQQAEQSPPCGVGQAYNRVDHSCSTCSCADGSTLYPLMSNVAGRTPHCICTPGPGKYFDETSHAIKECDHDQDGWVRINARDALEASDCALRVNAKCTVRHIDRFVLQGDENDAPREVSLVSDAASFDPLLTDLVVNGLDLYETEANDTFEVRGLGGSSSPAVPTYATGGDASASRAQLPQELNSLTKACGSLGSSGKSFDYNDNKIEDLDEWQGMTDYGSNMQAWQRPFVHFSYYLELYAGWFVPTTGTPGPDGKVDGAYVISEKGRGAELALSYPAGGQYWKSCHRHRDALYQTAPNADAPNRTMDFARYATPFGGSTGGMGHHGQFKCVQMATDGPNITHPEYLSAANAAVGYVANMCHLGAASTLLGTGAQGGNSYDPTLVCLPSTVFPTNDLVLVSAKYFNQFGNTVSYTRGCIDECDNTEHSHLPQGERCPGVPDDGSLPASVTCDSLEADYGNAVCGCGENFALEDCSIACADAHLMQNLGVDNANEVRTGFWLCGNTSVAGGDEPADGNGFVLSGSVAAPGVLRTTLSNETYTLK